MSPMFRSEKFCAASSGGRSWTFQHDEEDWRETGESNIFLHLDDGSMLEFVMADDNSRFAHLNIPADADTDEETKS